MGKVYKEEKRLVRFTYILIAICFINLSFITTPINTAALVMGAILMVLIGTIHFMLRRYFPKGDKYLYILACILATIGITMLYRLDVAKETSLAIKQIVWFIIGVTVYVFVIVLMPELDRLKKYRYIFLILTIIFMSMAKIYNTITGKAAVNGALNWVYIAGFSFQPSEFGKIFLVIYLAIALNKESSSKDEYLGFISDAMEKILGPFGKYYRVGIEPIFTIMFSLGFMVLQTDLGTALMIFGVSITMLYMATGNFKYMLATFALASVGAVAAYFMFAHVKRRVLIWRNPWPYVSGESYQLVQGFYGMAEGGVIGKGLGLGYPNKVPMCESDFIFSAISEEMGILVGFAIILIYLLMFYRSMRGAINIRDNGAKLLDVGLSTMIAIQSLVIVGGVTGAIPLTGITLPFVSYGGTSILSAFIILGILQKISEGEK